MIIATAGHIDHGKTTLVAAITGQSTDRLPEEKRRGISIELGFAHWAAPDGLREGSDQVPNTRLWSFVDVPGHERFVRHMIAGVQRIDAVLLVIAADDGIMPQTREHAAILSMLGHHDWVVALTKIDRVDADRIQSVRAEITDWLGDQGLAQTPIIGVDAPRAQGLPELLAALSRIEAGLVIDRRDDGRCFRMAVDRSFVLPGEGLILTGTVLSGQVGRDQRLVVSPSGLPVRVRTIRVAGQPAESASAAQRCALNVSGAGVERGSVERGDWLLDTRVHAPTRCVDVAIRWLQPMGAGRRVFNGHVHAGTALLSAQIRPFERGQDEPLNRNSPGARSPVDEASMLARLHLQSETCAAVADRWIIRSADAANTLGLAQVLLPNPRLTGQRGAAHAQSLRLIERAVTASVARRQSNWIRLAQESLSDLLPRLPAGVSAQDWAGCWHLAADTPAWQAATGAPGVLRRRWRGEERLFDAARLQTLSSQIVDRVAAHHRVAPNEFGMAMSSLLMGLAVIDRPVMIGLALEGLIAAGALRRWGDRLASPEHIVQSDPKDERVWAELEPLLSRDRSASVHELAETLSRSPESLIDALDRQAQLGRVVRVAANRYLTRQRFEWLIEQARRLAEQQRLSAAEFSRTTALGRNLSIEVLETFDRLRYTRRRGALRMFTMG